MMGMMEGGARMPRHMMKIMFAIVDAEGWLQRIFLLRCSGEKGRIAHREALSHRRKDGAAQY
jgi:hypothetical protein